MRKFISRALCIVICFTLVTTAIYAKLPREGFFELSRPEKHSIVAEIVNLFYDTEREHPSIDEHVDCISSDFLSTVLNSKSLEPLGVRHEIDHLNGNPPEIYYVTPEVNTSTKPPAEKATFEHDRDDNSGAYIFYDLTLKVDEEYAGGKERIMPCVVSCRFDEQGRLEHVTGWFEAD